MAQETFLRFIRYVETATGYLLTIAMNVCRDDLARKRRERAVEVPLDETWLQTGTGSGRSPRAGWRRKRRKHRLPSGGFRRRMYILG